MTMSANCLLLRQVLSAARATRRAEVCATRISARENAGAADGMIMKSEFAHRLGIQQVPPIEDDWRRHSLFQRGKIDIGKLIPLRGNDECLSAVDGFQRGRREFRV